MTHDPLCDGCKIADGSLLPAGGTAQLPGGWTVNQYQSGEGWLGWLALQPVAHKLRITDLSDEEAAALGPNLKTLDRLLTDYWPRAFPGDWVRRVYVVYFFEGAFQEPEPEPYHLHIHVIPSFKSLNVPGALRRRSGLQTWADGWWVPYLRARGMIPSDYSKQSEGWETRASAMMEYLRANLPQSHGTDGGLTTA